MIGVEVHRELVGADRGDVFDLVAAVEQRCGHRPLSDHLWLDLVHGGRTGFAAALARDPAGRLIGYCQVTRGHGSWALELVRSPETPMTHRAGEQLVGAALAAIADEGGGHVHWWVFSPDDDTAAIAAAHGLREGRTLLQLRVGLPLPAAIADPGVETRSFQVGVDEAAWLVVNNAAFHWHPEQGGWDLATLRQREAEPWFDADGFRVHERDGRMAAFCWTKLHGVEHAHPHREDHVHPDGVADHACLGEIYVVAVHPDFQGLGLGRALTVAGLASIAERQVPTGMLYVDQDNTGALEMYRSLGFTEHRVDQAYVGDIAPARTGVADHRGGRR